MMTTSYSRDDLFGALAWRARATSDGRLALAVVGGLAATLAMAIWRPFGWMVIGGIGLGLGYAMVLSLSARELSTRVWFGFGVGVLAYAGVDLVRDLIYGMKKRGGPQPARVYLVHGLLGGSIGAALGFYFDSAQVGVVVAKFHRYLAAGVQP